MIRKPLTPMCVKVVVANALSARRRMDESVVARVNRNVTDSAALFEEH
jgi:hypothetical protein